MRLTGQTRNEVGPQLLQVGPYEELMNVSTKWVLEKAAGWQWQNVFVLQDLLAFGLCKV